MTDRDAEFRRAPGARNCVVSGAFRRVAGAAATYTSAIALGLALPWLSPCVRAQTQVFPQWTQRFDAAHLPDGPHAIAADRQGNTYIIGSACLGAAPCSEQEVVTIKYDADGHLQWRAWLSSPSHVTQPVGVAVDAAGNVYVLALSYLVNEDRELLQPEFVTAKYNPAGVRLWICAVHEVVRDDIPWRIGVSPAGDVYVTGTSAPNVFIPNVGFAPDLLTIKYDTNGNQVWTRRRQVFSEFEPFAVAGLGLDSQENVFIAANGHQVGLPDGFIVKYDKNGTAVNEFKGPAFNAVFHVDAEGNSYVAGTAEPFPQSAPGLPEISKFDSNGRLVWELQTSDTSLTYEGISSDSFGQTYVADDETDHTGHRLGVLFKASADLGEPLWAQSKVFPGGPFSGSPVVLAVDEFGALYIASHGTIAKFDALGQQLWVQQFTGSTQDMTIGGDGGLFMTGTTAGSGGGANSSDWITIDYVQDGAKVSPPSLAFGNQAVGTQSAPQCVTLTNTVAFRADSNLDIASITISGDFEQTNKCPLTLEAGQVCLIHVSFRPSTTGTRSGTLAVLDQWEGSPRIVKLTGTGVH
jgi:hypothetical protein